VSDPSTRGAFPELSEAMRENSQRAQEIVSKHKKDRVLLTMLESKIGEAMDKKKKKA
jgi:predicted ATPase